MGGSQGGSGWWGCLWSSIVRGTSEHKYTQPGPENIENRITAFELINSPRITVLMCEETDYGYRQLYADEVFQPLNLQPIGFPDDPDHQQQEDGVESVQPPLDVEMDGYGVDVVEDEIGQDSKKRPDSKPL